MSARAPAAPRAGSAAGAWNDYAFTVRMPHMAPGEKLAEVEFLKMLGAYQWESTARALGRRASEIVNDEGERLYSSFVNVELHLGPRHSMEVLGEDARIRVRNQVRFFARKFVEGLFVIDDDEIDEAALAPIRSRADLERSGGSWACMTNAFIASTPGNVRLKVFRPAGAEQADLLALDETPLGITRQNEIQASGALDPLPARDEDTEQEIPLRTASDGPILYPVVPESDMNGAGLLYFARYPAVMNYGERLFLNERLGFPVSSELVAHLSPEHRRVFYFANAGPHETIEIRVQAALLPGRFRPPEGAGQYRIPWKLLSRVDLHRRSDRVLMASSLVRKALTVPGYAKSVLLEAERVLHRATP